MPRFYVECSETVRYSFEVEANSLEEAREIADTQYFELDGCPSHWDFQIDDIEEE